MARKTTVVLIICTIIAGIIAIRLFASPDAREGEGDLEAAMIAERFVKNELPYPETASFQPAYEARVTPLAPDGFGGYTYVVRSYVEAMDENRQMKKMPYRCKVQVLKNGNWMLLELIFD